MVSSADANADIRAKIKREMSYNPFLKPFNTPFDTLPFDRIKPEHFEPAIEQIITQTRKTIEQIAANPESPTFENTIEALEWSNMELDRVGTCFFNLNSAETSDEIQKIARNIAPVLTEFGNDILLNPDLFHRVETVYNQRENLTLDEEQKMLLDKTYRAFVRNGAALDDAQKIELREIDKKLSQLSLHFGENVLAETHDYTLTIDNPNALAGLPDETVESAAEEAKARGLDGKWVFTLDAPSYMPFVTYADDRNLRKEMALAYGQRAYRDNEHNNTENIREITALRHRRAQLLGFENHAEYVLAERMAKSPETVQGFLHDLLEKARPAAQKDLDMLAEYARNTDGLENLQRWDVAYYAEKLKKEKFGIDDETLKPYFKLENAVAGIFETARKLYGISFVENNDIPKYHPEVTPYEVLDEDGSHLAVFYADFFPRKGKRNGAWMTSYRSQYKQDGHNFRPHISIVCNFTKPTKTKPSLLTFNEVATLFHEFGHALHGMLANTNYPGLSGTNVYWDFVELPSQIMENWCFEKECLDLFATHYKTGEKLPESLVQKLKESATFMEGYQTLRQVSFALLDMAWHTGNPSPNDIEEFENRVLEPARLLPHLPNTSASCSFNHIFQGGYSAGYYSYKWAEVLDADAFERFAQEGLFNPQVARDFRALLAAGGSRHPMDLFVRFRGREPQPDALLRRAGLLTTQV